MRILLGLILGIALGVAAIWYLNNSKGRGVSSEHIAGRATSPASTNESFTDKLKSFKLSGDDIKEELAKTGRVIREKAGEAGRKLADASADTRVTATIKTKLVRDPDLSAWDISVNTTDGVVTLSGAVESEDKIGKAIALALDTDGVHQVISTLQIKGASKPAGTTEHPRPGESLAFN